MFRPRNQFLSSLFEIAAGLRDMTVYGFMDMLGLPHALHTSFFPAQDVEKLLLDGWHIEHAEKTDVFLENSLRIRLHAEPGPLPRSWRVGIEKLSDDVRMGEITETKWLNSWFTYDKAETLLTDFERAGFKGLVARHIQNDPGADAQVSARVVHDLHYKKDDLHPTHIVCALRLQLPHLLPQLETAPEKPAEKPASYPKVVNLLERKREIREGSPAKRRHPLRRR